MTPASLNLEFDRSSCRCTTLIALAHALAWGGPIVSFSSARDSFFHILAGQDLMMLHLYTLFFLLDFRDDLLV